MTRYLPALERGPRRGDPDLRKIAELPVTGKQQIIFSEFNPGLALNISEKGRRSWVFQTRLNGKSKRMKLAEWGVDAEELLARWREYRDAVSRGADPLAEARQAEAGRAVTAMTLNDAVGRFLAVRKDKLRPATKGIYLKTMRLWAPEWEDMKLTDIKPEMVVAKYQEITRSKSAASANTWLSGFRSVMNFSVAMDWIEKNPCDAIKNLRLYEKTPARQNVLKLDDLPKWWGLLESRKKGGDVIFPRMLQTALLTGMRRGEIGGLRWSWIDMNKRIITLPASLTKSNKERILPITDFVFGILQEQLAITERVNSRAPRQAANDLVFFSNWQTLRPKKKLVQGWSHATTQVADVTGISVSWHDLRRTWASLAATTSGMNEAIRKTVMGHSGGDVTSVHYTVLEIDDVRAAMQAVECRILATVDS